MIEPQDGRPETIRRHVVEARLELRETIRSLELQGADPGSLDGLKKSAGRLRSISETIRRAKHAMWRPVYVTPTTNAESRLRRLALQTLECVKWLWADTVGSAGLEPLEELSRQISDLHFYGHPAPALEIPRKEPKRQPASKERQTCLAEASALIDLFQHSGMSVTDATALVARKLKMPTGGLKMWRQRTKAGLQADWATAVYWTTLELGHRSDLGVARFARSRLADLPTPAPKR